MFIILHLIWSCSTKTVGLSSSSPDRHRPLSDRHHIKSSWNATPKTSNRSFSSWTSSFCFSSSSVGKEPHRKSLHSHFFSISFSSPDLVSSVTDLKQKATISNSRSGFNGHRCHDIDVFRYAFTDHCWTEICTWGLELRKRCQWRRRWR